MDTATIILCGLEDFGDSKTGKNWTKPTASRVRETVAEYAQQRRNYCYKIIVNVVVGLRRDF